MLRRAFVRRMIFAGLATWFLDLPLPQESGYTMGKPTTVRGIGEESPLAGRPFVLSRQIDGGPWEEYATGTFGPDGGLVLS